MRRALGLICLLFLFAVPAFGQTTTVSATITDLGGQQWKQGTYTFQFRPSPLNPTGPYFLNGVPFPIQQSILGHMDTSGAFSVSVPSNTSITPSGSTWDLQVCPISQGNTTCYTQQSITITGSTQSLSSSVRPPPALIDLAHPAYPFVMAYTNSEFSTAPMGGVYYDYTQAHYFLCSNVNPTGQAQWYGTCSTWKEFCFVGDGLCGGAVSTLTIEHNGTVVGTQPILNFIDGSNITLTVTNNAGLTRVDTTIAATGGGSGCTLPGINTAVLSEHPAGTCYDSLNWTWDDGASKQNMQAGISNTAGFSDSFIFGTGNNGSGMTSSQIHGDGNVLSSAASNLYVVGLDNGITGTPLNCSQCVFMGAFNRFPGSTHASTYGAFVDDSGAFGNNNNFNFSNTGTSGGNPTDVWINGSGNILTESGTQSAAISSVHITGSSNTIEDTLNGVDIVDITGSNNDVNGALTTAQILGYHNTLDNVSTGVDTTVVGAFNTLSGVATATYSLASGFNMQISNCDACYAYGQNVHLSTSNTLAIGMSTAPEILVTPGKVNVTAWPVSQEQTISICASGCTITQTPCSITSGASYDVCNNTITWPNSFADANYTVTCTGQVSTAHASAGNGSTNYSLTTFVQLSSLSSTQFTVVTQNQRTNNAGFDRLDCTGIHR